MAAAAEEKDAREAVGERAEGGVSFSPPKPLNMTPHMLGESTAAGLESPAAEPSPIVLGGMDDASSQSAPQSLADLITRPRRNFVEEGRNRRIGKKTRPNPWFYLPVGNKIIAIEQTEVIDPDKAPTKIDVNEITISPAFQRALHKAKCDVCNMWFERESVGFRVSWKRIMQLRETWGYRREGRRYNAASFVYSEASVCLFCSQFFRVQQDEFQLAMKTCPQVPTAVAEKLGLRRPVTAGESGSPGKAGMLARAASTRTLGRVDDDPRHEHNSSSQPGSRVSNGRPNTMANRQHSTTATRLPRQLSLSSDMKRDVAADAFARTYSPNTESPSPARSPSLATPGAGGRRRPRRRPTTTMSSTLSRNSRRTKRIEQLMKRAERVYSAKEDFLNKARLASGMFSDQELPVFAELVFVHCLPKKSAEARLMQCSAAELRTARIAASLPTLDVFRLLGRLATVLIWVRTGQHRSEVGPLFQNKALRYIEENETLAWLRRVLTATAAEKARYESAHGRPQQSAKPSALPASAAATAELEGRDAALGTVTGMPPATDTTVNASAMMAATAPPQLETLQRTGSLTELSTATATPAQTNLESEVASVGGEGAGNAPALSATWAEFLILIHLCYTNQVADARELFLPNVPRPRDGGGPSAIVSSPSDRAATVGAPPAKLRELLEAEMRKRAMRGGGTRALCSPELLNGTRRQANRDRPRTVAADSISSDIARPWDRYMSDPLNMPSEMQMDMWRIQYRLEDREPQHHKTGFERIFSVPLGPLMPQQQSVLNLRHTLPNPTAEDRPRATTRLATTAGGTTAGVGGTTAAGGAAGPGSPGLLTGALGDSASTSSLDEFVAAVAAPSVVQIGRRGMQKPCPLCKVHFPSESLEYPVLVKTLLCLLRRWDPVLADSKRFIEKGMGQYHRVRICRFCSQFFDPDEESGLAAPRCAENKEIAGYIRYFDDRFPDSYTAPAMTPQQADAMEIRTRSREASKYIAEHRPKSPTSAAAAAGGVQLPSPSRTRAESGNQGGLGQQQQPLKSARDGPSRSSSMGSPGGTAHNRRKVV